MFIAPDQIINNFDIRPGQVVADFGSGSGHYVMAAARKMNGDGVVYAIDIQKNLLESVKSAAEKNHLGNVEIIWADVEGKEGVKLASGSVDLVIISNLLFQLTDKEAAAKEAHRVLKDGGKAAVIDWTKMMTGGGVVFPKQEAEKLFLQQGFAEEKEFEAGDNHYGIIFKK
ncbi:methyltransferase domain-containing protein [Candidatus Parcubacteria bacterium]|nr:MAG: methyltransferase domain-containing protein [Candidatus Parcubacteria bacterium]